MKNRIKAPVIAAVAVVALSGCDLLDVDNPNSLVEESIQLEAAANGVANGSLQLVSEALADVWEGPAVVSDELYWIGSRDAWGSLDQGGISDPNNEFTDAAFPSLGRSAWMAQNAVEILQRHVAENPGESAFELDLARSLMFRGMILMVTAESQQDMTFSYKMVDGPPVSSGNATIGSEGQHAVPSMVAVMDLAISSLTDAIDDFTALGETDFVMDATAMRARAYMSRAIMQNRDTDEGALAFPNAVADANTVIAGVGDDWLFNLSYSSASAACDMCGNVNNRKENQIDLSLVTVDASNDINGIRLDDPVSGTDDPALRNRLNQWKGGDFVNTDGNQYPDLTVVSQRLMYLIVAEDALANNGDADGDPDFAAAINSLRDLDDDTPAFDFASGGAHGLSDLEFLQHSRRVSTLLTGLRLPDMYRWNLRPGPDSFSGGRWLDTSPAVTARGTMLPITVIEVRANCFLNTTGCGG